MRIHHATVAALDARDDPGFFLGREGIWIERTFGGRELRLSAEAGDLLFHVVVGLRARGLDFGQVVQKLATRTGQSGHAEKASRKG